MWFSPGVVAIAQTMKDREQTRREISKAQQIMAEKRARFQAEALATRKKKEKEERKRLRYVHIVGLELKCR